MSQQEVQPPPSDKPRTPTKTLIEPPVVNGKKTYTINGSKYEVDSRYSLIRALGVGAYGTVCSAMDNVTNSKCAIKRMAHLYDDLVDGKRVLREVKVLSQLKHPNILGFRTLMRPLDLKTFEDIYMVSDLYDADLHRIIRSKQKLSDEHCQYFVWQAFRGLHYIHSADVMHRDLKPGNLLVNSNCELVLCDFGLARGFSPKDLTEYVITRWYRPPELLLLSTKYTSAVDMWSIGLIFAELINRKTLLAGRDYINQLSLILDILGSPSEEDMATMSNEANRYIASLPKKKPSTFSALFPTATPQALDLLSKLLVFNPAKRLTAKEALQHPYLARLKQDSREQEAGFKFHWSLDSVELNEQKLREGFVEEILKCNPTPADASS